MESKRICSFFSISAHRTYSTADRPPSLGFWASSRLATQSLMTQMWAVEKHDELGIRGGRYLGVDTSNHFYKAEKYVPINRKAYHMAAAALMCSDVPLTVRLYFSNATREFIHGGVRLCSAQVGRFGEAWAGCSSETSCHLEFGMQNHHILHIKLTEQPCVPPRHSASR